MATVTETIEVKVDAGRLLAFAALVEKHAAAIRADLEQFIADSAPGSTVPSLADQIGET